MSRDRTVKFGLQEVILDFLRPFRPVFFCFAIRAFSESPDSSCSVSWFGRLSLSSNSSRSVCGLVRFSVSVEAIEGLRLLLDANLIVIILAIVRE